MEAGLLRQVAEPSADRESLVGVRWVAAEQPDLPGVGREHGRQDAQQRGLPAPLGPSSPVITGAERRSVTPSSAVVRPNRLRTSAIRRSVHSWDDPSFIEGVSRWVEAPAAEHDDQHEARELPRPGGTRRADPGLATNPSAEHWTHLSATTRRLRRGIGPTWPTRAWRPSGRGPGATTSGDPVHAGQCERGAEADRTELASTTAVEDEEQPDRLASGERHRSRTTDRRPGRTRPRRRPPGARATTKNRNKLRAPRRCRRCRGRRSLPTERERLGDEPRQSKRRRGGEQTSECSGTPRPSRTRSTTPVAA